LNKWSLKTINSRSNFRNRKIFPRLIICRLKNFSQRISIWRGKTKNLNMITSN